MPQAWFFFDFFKSALALIICTVVVHAPTSAFARCESDAFETGFLTAAEIGSGDGERLRQISEATAAAHEKAEPSPFRTACKDPSLIKDRPKTGLFRREVPFSDGKGRKSADFLNRVGASVLDAMKKQDADLLLIEDCLSGKTKTKDCQFVDRWMNEDLTPIVRSARMNLALAVGTSHLDTFSQAVSKKPLFRPNLNLSGGGTTKEVSWDPLTAREKSQATQIIKEYFDESSELAKAAIQRREVKATGRLAHIRQSVFKTNLEHAHVYKKMLAEFPILQELRSEVPGQKEVLTAIKKMREHLASDTNYVRAGLNAANEKMAPSRGRRDGVLPPEIRTSMNPDALRILEFKSFVEAELLKTPQDCALVTSLVHTSDNRALGTGLALGVPLVAAALVLPFVGQVALGTAIGLVGGVGFAAQAKVDRDQAADRFISKLVAEDEAYENFDQADTNLKLSVGLGVAGAAAGPVVSGTIRATRLGSSAAVNTTRKLFEAFRKETPAVPPEAP